MNAKAALKKRDPFYTFPKFGNSKYKDKDMIYNNPLEPSRLFGNVKTTGVATLANSNFPLINKVFDISADGLTIWAMKDFEIANHDISMDILVYNAQTSSECFMYDVRARLKAKKAVLELQSMSTVWHLKFEFTEMEASNCKNLTSFLEKEGKYSCLLDGTNTFSDFIC
jgi:hypothetical protein